MIKNSTKLKVIDNSGGKIARCIDVVGKKKVKKRCIYFGLIVNIKY